MSTKSTAKTGAALGALTLTLGVGLATSSPADEVTSGSLTWGLKTSFRSYVQGPIANGKITSSGASLNNGIPTFGGGRGSVDGNKLNAQFSGSVKYYGHDGALDMTLSNPKLTLNGSTGTLAVTLQGNGQGTRVVTVATVSNADVRVINGEVKFSNLATALTQEGASIFAYQGNNFYSAGTALDPISGSVKVKVAANPPATKPAPSNTTKPPAATPPSAPNNPAKPNPAAPVAPAPKNDTKNSSSSRTSSAQQPKTAASSDAPAKSGQSQAAPNSEPQAANNQAAPKPGAAASQQPSAASSSASQPSGSSASATNPSSKSAEANSHHHIFIHTWPMH